MGRSVNIFVWGAQGHVPPDLEGKLRSNAFSGADFQPPENEKRSPAIFAVEVGLRAAQR